MRILVVDDEPLVAQTVSAILSKRGYDVTTTLSAEAALRSVRQSPPDLVLCDISMPVRDGISLMQDIGRLLPSCPILVLTGDYAGLTRIAACAASLRQTVRVLTKPCPPLELLRETASLLHSA